MKTFTTTKMKNRTLKIQFEKVTRFSVPPRQAAIRSWTQRLFGTRLSLRALAMAERPKYCGGHVD